MASIAAGNVVFVLCLWMAKATDQASVESMAMQPWANLKGSMDKIGQQVEQIQVVGNDINSLRSDLRAQTNLWRQAEVAMQHENDALNGQIVALRAALSAGAHAADDVSNAKRLLMDDEHRQQQLHMAQANSAKQDIAQQASLEKRKADLGVHLKELNASAYAEVQTAEHQRIELHSDAVAFKLRVHELHGRLSDSHKQLALQQNQSDMTVADLRRQLAGMHQDLVKLKAQVAAGDGAEQREMKELPDLGRELSTESAELLKFQQLHTEIATECNAKTQEREQVLGIERGQASMLRTSSLQYCNPIRMQERVLKAWLSECWGASQPAEAGSPVAFTFQGIQNAPASNLPTSVTPAMSFLKQSRYTQ